MSSGILKDEKCKDTFERVFDQFECRECRKERSGVADLKPERKYKNRYSNFLPGFSTRHRITVPVDLLIVLQGHSGGEQRVAATTLEEAVEDMRHCYMEMMPYESFHQYATRELLEELEKRKVRWACTDFIKCFIKTGDGYEESERIAQRYCGYYLDSQIKNLKPKKVLSLGGRTTSSYFKEKFEHGRVVKGKEQADRQFDLVISYFPSQWSADRWARGDGWNPILRNLREAP